MYTAPRQIGCNGLSGIDLSTWTWEDYLLIGAGAAGLYYFFAGDEPKRKRKPMKASTGFAGGLGTALVLGVGAYFAYQYYVGSVGAGTYPALPIPPMP